MDTNNSNKKVRVSQKWLYIFANALVVIFMGIVYFQIEDSVQKQIELSKHMLVQEAVAHFDNMVVTRSWNALHSGLYYKAKADEKPNPYLPDNHTYTKDGELLIKVNPAWMTRQISELSNKQSKYYYKITSLRPINPHNTPVGFEVEALKFFEKNPQKTYYYKINHDFSKFDFMGRLKVEQSCLQCHAQQGYKEGDVRGGIRVSIPTLTYKDKLDAIYNDAFWTKILVALGSVLSLVFINLGVFLIYRYQSHIEDMNNVLEEKVRIRTKKLEKMYHDEKYLKEILKTIADVNELLISSFTVETIIQNTTERLNKHQHYCALWIGLLQDDILEIVHTSFVRLKEQLYDISNEQSEPEVITAIKAIKQSYSVIEKIKLENNAELLIQCNSEEISKWMISLPLISSNEEKTLGVINVYSNRENGFEAEEIKMLENLATDIAIALHAIFQRAMLKEMELEKITNYEETILAFVNIIEQRDSYTAGHTIRVAKYCRLIANELGVSEEEIVQLEKAAILHDIGKVATPDAILLKPGKLIALEYELIKQHAEAGYKMLSNIKIYEGLSELIRYHHVRYDGTGYPRTESPEEVSLLSHIMVLADAFDAMTTNRIYKPRKDVKEALKEIEYLSGKQFHPKVVEVALKALKDVEIEETKQLPINELEKKRFAYFFEDALTNYYNESYLQVILSDENRTANNLYIIYLKKFSEFNKKNGWIEGNRFLKEVADLLHKLYLNALLFRYRGDDFVILKADDTPIDIDMINDYDFIKSSGVSVLVRDVTLHKESYSVEELEK